ncbi:MAG: DUF192 domain-containing protein [Pseudomonadota bacterium]
MSRLILTLWFGVVLTGFAQATDFADLRIKTQMGAFTLKAELALDDATRTQGLMHRETMPANYGMLFIFDELGPKSMWMKDTHIPLDMLFLGDDGRILDIALGAEPFSHDIISGRGNIRAVMEVHAGMAGRLGLQRGDSTNLSVIIAQYADHISK